MKHISLEQRYQIEILIDAKKTNKEISELLGFNKSTIGREISRCKMNRANYDPEKAHRDQVSKRNNRSNYKFDNQQKSTVKHYLQKLQWSPEQISERLKKEKRHVTVSHETIYRYVYNDAQQGGELYKELRHSKKKRKQQGSRLKKKEIIPNRVSIDYRPNVVESKGRFGDWEADTVIGTQASGGGVLVTLTERKSKYLLMKKVTSKSSSEVIPAILEMIEGSPIPFKTITFDNGTEFTAHEDITKEYGIETYFAHPYHSWERGLNENTNGLIRQYLPKRKAFNDKEDSEIRQIEQKINNRPRKTLEFLSPVEFYNTKFNLTEVAFEC